MKPNRTAEGKVVIYHAVTGKAVERWPVDARAQLASGEFVEFPPEGALHPYETAEVPAPPKPAEPAAPPRDPLGIATLPTVTPIGAPAVHSTAADSGPAVPHGDQPARRTRRSRGQ